MRRPTASATPPSSQRPRTRAVRLTRETSTAINLSIKRGSRVFYLRYRTLCFTAGQPWVVCIDPRLDNRGTQRGGAAVLVVHGGFDQDVGMSQRERGFSDGGSAHHRRLVCLAPRPSKVKGGGRAHINGLGSVQYCRFCQRGRWDDVREALAHRGPDGGSLVASTGAARGVSE